MAPLLLKEIPLKRPLHSLPVRCAAQQDESGMGFLLRCATANGLSLHGLRDLAGFSSPRVFWRSDAWQFARLLETPEAEMEGLLIDKGKYTGEPAYRLQGQMFYRTELLRLKRPQICVDCIHRTGYCKAVWDCRLYAVCHIHRKPMVDRCGACSAPLRWYRPAVDVCQCGAYFRAPGDHCVGQRGEEVRVATWIAEYFAECKPDFSDAQGLPDWMSALSLDGLCTLIRAMGSLVAGHQRVLRSRQADEPVEFWMDVCVRAVQRLTAYARSVDPAELAPLVWEGALEGWALAFVAQADQQVALQLLREICGVEIMAHFGSQRSALCQMRLFEDER
jgi:hypothetical protein